MEKESKLVFFLKKIAKESQQLANKHRVVQKIVVKPDRKSQQPDINAKYFAQLKRDEEQTHILKRQRFKNSNILYRSLDSNGISQTQRAKVDEKTQVIAVRSEVKRFQHLQSIQEITRTQKKQRQNPLRMNLGTKIPKNIISFGKMPNQQQQLTATISQNFNTYQEFKQYMSKISQQSQLSQRTQQTDYQNDSFGTCSKRLKFIPILKNLHPKHKGNYSPGKNGTNLTQFEEYIKTRRVKIKGPKQFMIESKKQQLATHAVSRYKANQKYRQEQKVNTSQNELNIFNIESIKKLNDKQLEDIEEVLKVDDYKNKKNSSPKTKSHRTKQQRNISFFFNNNEEGIYQQKIRTYRQFLFIVNLAHKIYDPIVISDGPSSRQQKANIFRPTYYIGGGNNCMLVRSLMKRRIWWDQVQQYEKANFVWTQLKIPAIFKDQAFVQSRFQAQIQVQNQNTSQKNVKTTISSRNDSSVDKFFTTQKCIKNSEKNKNKPKGLVFRAPYLVKNEQKILTSDDYTYYKKFVERSSKLDYDNFDNRIKFFPKDYFDMKPPIEKIRMHNHFEFNHFLGNKKALFYHLQFYYELIKKPLNLAFPNTFHIKMGQNDPQFKKFQEQFQRIAKQQKRLKNIWIIKPGQNSNRGSGIIVIKELKNIRKILASRQRHKNGQLKTYIIQKYIERPLLYRGRKFDIRHYMIVSGIHQRLRAYWYGQGYIRTSSYFFNLEEVNDPMIHLTNDAIQKDCQDYGCYEQGNKISYNQLQRYFNEQQPHRGFDFGIIFSKMRDLAKDAIFSTYYSIDPFARSHNFEVFGLDFMIDENMNVMLIQVNTNPCLQLSCNLLSRIIPFMLEQTLRISLDPIFSPSTHYTNNTRHLAPDCNLQKLQMELIFDSKRDGPYLGKLYTDNLIRYKQMMKMLQGSQKQVQEIFEDEGVQIQIEKFMT